MLILDDNTFLKVIEQIETFPDRSIDIWLDLYKNKEINYPLYGVMNNLNYIILLENDMLRNILKKLLITRVVRKKLQNTISFFNKKEKELNKIFEKEKEILNKFELIRRLSCFDNETLNQNRNY